MACKKEYVELMHKYLDREITRDEEYSLRSHLQSCEACQSHFHELKRTVTLLETTSKLQVSSNFTEKVMNHLPKENKRISYMRWFKRHPILSAAAVFFIFMFGSILSVWNQDSQLSVSKEKDLIIQGDTIIVPEGVTVEGDLVVKNGDLKVDGSINGDVVIINGEHLMASAGDVVGEIDQVNQVFEWIWYSIKGFFKEVFSLANIFWMVP
ncbi:zf-HC2 domain-containing protein [Aquibacillus salsiterrae]|uniref:Anti-sigma-W factor RsiW n=1 Tax=Aquibacillus salsiterrae TaxID=2950439 RepID=A0A9X4AGJ3_9BACI|nr:zf-HC2 domain-containing protein [Aquibacillus salsiterrae]MDC3417173.1 zf-HC2 domain-containing protein [Aquibacillus salsiterrae]